MLLGTRYFSGVEGIFQDQHGSPFFDQGEMRGFEPVELKKYPEAHRVHAVAPAVVAGPPLSTMIKCVDDYTTSQQGCNRKIDIPNAEETQSTINQNLSSRITYDRVSTIRIILIQPSPPPRPFRILTLTKAHCGRYQSNCRIACSQLPKAIVAPAEDNTAAHYCTRVGPSSSNIAHCSTCGIENRQRM